MEFIRLILVRTRCPLHAQIRFLFERRVLKNGEMINMDRRYFNFDRFCAIYSFKFGSALCLFFEGTVLDNGEIVENTNFVSLS